MAKGTEVKVRITGDSKSVEQATKRTESGFKRMGAAIKRNALAITAAVAGTVIALRGLATAIGSSVSAAFEQERAVRTMNAALKQSGEFSKEAAANVRAWADALAQTNATTDQAVLRGFALAKAFGATNEQAKLMVVTAQDFAAKAEIEFVEALRRIGRATQGSTEDIAKYAPAILDLTRAQLQAGEATNILHEATKGLAAELAAGTEGRVKNLSIAWGEMVERLGESATQSSETSDAIARLTEFIRANEGALATWISGAGGVFVEIIGGIADKATRFGTAIGAITATMLEWSGAFGEVEARSEALLGVAGRLGITVEELQRRMAEAAHEINQVNTETDDAADGMENLANKTDKAGGAAEALTDNFKTATEAAIGLGNALGEVTSIELALEIEKINEALVESAETLDKNSAEYERLERIAVAKIERIRERIRNLRDGLGDLQTQTEESGRAWENYAVGVDRAVAATDRLLVSTNTLRGDFARQQAERRSLGTSDFAQIGGGTFTFQSPGVTQDPDGRLRVA